MNRKMVFVIVIIIAALASSGFCYPKICIDPGHGGSDPGAVGYVTEKGINLDTGLKMKDWLNLDTSDSGGGYAWSAIMTRSTDVFVSLQGRCDYANNNSADRFFSIHSNSASDSSANGSETYCYSAGGAYSYDLRNKAQSELISHGGLYNRGNKTADYYVLIYTNMAAVLTELGFVSNSSDSSSLGSSTWRNEVAKGFLHACQTHYGYSAYTPSTGVTYIVDNSSSGFSASSNWYTSTSTPGYYGTNYHVRPAASVSDAATWTTSVASAGTYSVYAWWTAGTNRCTAAPYIVYYNGGSSTVNVNQQANGGKWNSLGSFSLAAGSNQVKLSCWTSSGSYLIADAIKWYK